MTRPMYGRYGVARFKLELELGNDALRTRAQLVSLLRSELEHLEEEGFMGKVIKDENGNTAGRMRLILPTRIKEGWE